MMNFHEMTRNELRKLAGLAKIEGRSQMSKDELAAALEYTGIGECRAGAFTKGQLHMCVIPGDEHRVHEALNGLTWNAL